MGWFGFGEKETIADLINELPASGITVMSLKSLDFVVPEGWNNYTDFDKMLRTVTGETEEAFLQSVKNRAIALYNDSSQGYQSAMQLYQRVDTADKALGAAAWADKLSQKFSLLSLMSYLTPKADTAQAIDLALKTITELLAFTKINGIPGDSFGDFLNALKEYSGESKIRMAGLICFDGLIPLGPDFIDVGMNTLGNLRAGQLSDNKTYRSIHEYIPGADAERKLGFIRTGFAEVQDWMHRFISQNHLSANQVTNHLRTYVDFADDKLDYLAAFLDVFTNYFQHTGTQTLAVRLIERAVNEV